MTLPKYPDLRTAILSDATAFNQSGVHGISAFDYKKNNLACRQIEAIYGMAKYELNLRESWKT